MKKRVPFVVGALGLALALVAGACTSNSKTTTGVAAPKPVKTIPQPSLDASLQKLPIAPVSARVDLAMPIFSNPTEIANPLFPISKLRSVVQLGTVDGKPFRAEVTLLPETKTIVWNGQSIENLVSQYVAYLDGRIHEVALDFYAQDDAGAVWYFGEDVFNYEDGVVADTGGTWIAGKDGPAAMIMPAKPTVGDVYRPENIPGLVFEEVTIKSVGQTVNGPLGPVAGAIVAHELHQDGQTEDKTFAPGYAEFFTGDGVDKEFLALSVPTDALPGPEPAELQSLWTGSTAIFDRVPAKDWKGVASTLASMKSAWSKHQTGNVPEVLATNETDALAALGKAVSARDAAKARQAAIDVGRATLDLQLQYRDPAQIDLGRIDIFARQAVLDLAAGDRAGVAGDLAVLDILRARFTSVLGSADVSEIDLHLGAIRVATVTNDKPAAAKAVLKLREIIAGLKPLK